MTYSEKDERLRLQDLAIRAKVGHWRTLDLMQPSDYTRPRDLVPFPWRETAKPSALIHRQQLVCAGSPKTVAQAAHRSNYALRIELGDRAYAELTGKRIRRTPKGGVHADERPKATVVVERPAYANSTRAVSLTDTQLMADLGIRPIRMAEFD